MDIKIKKEQNDIDRKLDIPTFKDSSEINKELDQVEFKEHNVSPKDTMKFEKHEDNLELTTQFITTEFNTDSFETLEVDTIDLEQDIHSIEVEYNNAGKRDEDTIKIKQSEYIELEDGEDHEPVKREFNINLKYIYYLIGLIVVILVGVLGYGLYSHFTSQQRFVSTALETPFEVSAIDIYGESVNLISSTPYEKIELYNLDDKSYTEAELGKSIDEQLHFSKVEEGEYYIFVDGQIATSEADIDLSMQTITRDGENKDVKFTTDDNNVIDVDVKIATNQQVDILIDPSQGSIQGFLASDSVTTEQELSLKYGLALKSSLQELGYNVSITREDDSVPGDCDYQDTYCADGRVAMAYKNNPKLYIQIGFNGQGGNGFEISDSYLNSHTLARLLKSSLSPLIEPSTRVSGQLESGIYVNTYDDEAGNKVDYLYSIRETGGAIMGSDNEDASELNSNPVGAEAVAIDLGYISQSSDFEQLNDDEEIDAIAKAMASAIDQYIKQY